MEIWSSAVAPSLSWRSTLELAKFEKRRLEISFSTSRFLSLYSYFSMMEQLDWSESSCVINVVREALQDTGAAFRIQLDTWETLFINLQTHVCASCRKVCVWLKMSCRCWRWSIHFEVRGGDETFWHLLVSVVEGEKYLLQSRSASENFICCLSAPFPGSVLMMSAASQDVVRCPPWRRDHQLCQAASMTRRVY